MAGSAINHSAAEDPNDELRRLVVELGSSRRHHTEHNKLRHAVARGADLDLEYGGQTPLSVAVQFRAVQTAAALCDLGASVDKAAPGLRGMTPLLYALTDEGAFDNTEMVRMLLSRGADPNKLHNGKTARQLARNVTQEHWPVGGL